MPPFVAKRRCVELLNAFGKEEGYPYGRPSGFFQNSLTDCRRRSTSHTVYSPFPYLSRWHGVSALTETVGIKKAKRARTSFEDFSTAAPLARLDFSHPEDTALLLYQRAAPG